jgi:predicted ArsR family transcriptional regulator
MALNIPHRTWVTVNFPGIQVPRMSDANRDSGGKYTPAVSDEDILEAMDRIPGPVTTAAELADALPIGRRAIRERLKDFEKRGLVARKKVGGRAVVWWISSDEEEDDAPDFRAGYGAFAGTDFADAVDEVRDELDRDFRESEDELFEDEADP